MSDIEQAFNTVAWNVEKIAAHFNIEAKDVIIDWWEKVFSVEIDPVILGNLNYNIEDFNHFCEYGITDMNGTMVFQNGLVIFSFTPKPETTEEFSRPSGWSTEEMALAQVNAKLRTMSSISECS